MDPVNAKPRLLKQANLSSIRRTIKSKGTATRAEIAAKTKISSTTVRSLLAEMLQSGEIESVGYDESSGGRKAERYRFLPGRYHSAAFCISGSRLRALIVNANGEILESSSVDVPEGRLEPAISAFLDRAASEGELRSIGIGVPGAVEGEGYWRKNPRTNELNKVEIGAYFARKYGLPVVLENDLNAAAIGFARRRRRENPSACAEETDLVYLNFEKGCVSAGILAGGRAVRGSRRFAGELGLIPMPDGRSMDEWMAAPMDDGQYVRLVAGMLCWICGILNPGYVVLGGPELRRGCVPSIRETLSALLPGQLRTEIFGSPGLWDDYCEGMAELTAAKMFDEVRLVKERPC